MAIDNAKVQELVEAIGILLGKVNTAINTRVAADSAKLEGKTLAEVTALGAAASQDAIDALAADLAAFIARRDNPNQVTKAQVGLGSVVDAGFATQEQAEAGEAANVYASPLSTAQYLSKWWAEQLGTTPETLDTIEEIAQAISNNAEAIDAIRDIAAGKETPAGAQAKVDAAVAALEALIGDKLDADAQAADAAKLEGKTLAEVLADATAAVADDLAQLRTDVDSKLTQAQVRSEIAAVTDPLADRISAVEEAVTGGTGSLLTTDSDLGANKVALTGDEEGAELTLKAHLEGFKAAQADQDTAIDAATAAASAADDKADAAAAAASTADGKAEAAGTAAAAAQETADQATTALADKLGKTEQAADAAKLEGKTLAEILGQAGAGIADGELNPIVADLIATGGTNLTAEQVALVQNSRLSALQSFMTASKVVGSVVTGSWKEVNLTQMVANDNPEAPDTTLAALLAAIKAEDGAEEGDVWGVLAHNATGGGGTFESRRFYGRNGTWEQARYSVENTFGAFKKVLYSTDIDLDNIQAVDSEKLGGKTLADLTASVQDANEGTADDKFVTPEGLKAVVDANKADTQSALNAIALQQGAQDEAISKVETDVDALIDQLTVAFNDGAALFEPTQPQ